MWDRIAPGVVALFAKNLSSQLNDTSRVIVLTSQFVENAPMGCGGSRAGQAATAMTTATVWSKKCVELRAAGQVASVGGWLTGDSEDKQMTRHGGSSGNDGWVT